MVRPSVRMLGGGCAMGEISWEWFVKKLLDHIWELIIVAGIGSCLTFVSSLCDALGVWRCIGIGCSAAVITLGVIQLSKKANQPQSSGRSPAAMTPSDAKWPTVSSIIGEEGERQFLLGEWCVRSARDDYLAIWTFSFIDNIVVETTMGNRSRKGTWKFEDKAMRITWSNGRWDSFSRPVNCTRMRGENWTGVPLCVIADKIQPPLSLRPPTR